MQIVDAGPRWTIEAIDRLRELAGVRVPAEIISQAMHRPMDEIVAKAAEFNLTLYPAERDL
ncbi:hypothetical protein C3941_15395 [Kaistia algarum]|uniref:hypothetical protein n=1 Tax=Kaistia algarum TaxID=2083279 RepID=UPI000CE8FB1C|nr:hypothetical protein [Kaistia algarum]MCX5514458.1 hypothetical protein [Kaistia algarum]PPE79190.1 hypothetical protein C3941_15395 [Kaistia algarum]